MTNPLKRERIAEGTHFNRISDPRFKFNRIVFGFFVPLDKEKASLYALIPRLFHRTNAEYPKSKDFNNYLASLYNAKVDFEVASIGDTQFLGISMNFMDDSYALHGEKITEAASYALFNCVFNQPVADGNAFDNANVELCKREQIEAIEAEINDKRVYASNQARRIICEGEPAAINPLGTVEKTREITPESLLKAAVELFSNAVFEIICVGCNDFDSALKIAKEYFPAEQFDGRKTLPCESVYSPLKKTVSEKIEKLPVLNQSKVVLGFKTDSKNRAALTLMSNLYGGTLSSKLFLNVRERLSLCYYCWSRLSKEKGVMSVVCGVEEENIEKAREEIISQLELIKTGDITADELNSALLFEQNNIKTVNDSLSSLTWWYISRIYAGEIKSPEQFLKNYEGITSRDIIEAADSMRLDTIYVLSGEEKCVGDDISLQEENE
ncbi:MAG: insulinase family protein [Oscillospiraceae bacterium]|nr:insulinase family protein [Oscillospiraceae bacterium]